MAVKTSQQLTGASADLWKRGKAAADANNRDYAISLLQSVLKVEPALLEARQTLRAVEIHKYKSQSAIAKQLNSVKTATGAMKAGNLIKKDPAGAMAAAEEVLALDPYHPKANEILAEAAEALDIPEISILAHETVADERPDDKNNLHQLAMLCVKLKDFTRAIKAYERILSIDPRDGDAQSGVKNATAQLASSTGGWEKASAEGGDFRGALKDKSEAIRLEQESKVAKSDTAIEDQIARLRDLVDREPANLNHPKKIADLYKEMEDFENAIVWYQYAYEQGGKADASLEKTIGTLSLRKVDQDITNAEQYAASDEAWAAHLEALRSYRKELGLQTAQLRVQRYPNDKQFHYELGKAFVELGRYREALPALQEGKKQPSVRLDAANLLGVCQWKLNMFDLAEKSLREAAAEIPVMNDIKKEILYNLAAVQGASNKSTEEIETLKQIYEVDISYRDVAARVEASYGAA